MKAKEILEIFNNKAHEPTHYARAFASYLSSKVAVTSELLDIFTGIYREGILYNDDGSVDEQVLPKEYWEMPILIKPIQIGDKPGNYDYLYIDCLDFCKSINGCIDADEPDIASVEFVDRNLKLTVLELLDNLDYPYQNLQNGIVATISLMAPFNFSVDGQDVLKGELVSFEKDDLSKEVVRDLTSVPMIHFDLFETLNQFTENTIKSNAIVAIFETLGQGDKVDSSVIMANIEKVVGRFDGWKDKLDFDIVNVASDVAMSAADRITMLISNLKDGLTELNDNAQNDCYYDDEVGLNFNKVNYSGISASSVWTCSNVSSKVGSVFATTGAILVSAGKAVLAVAKTVFSMASRLWKKYITPAYQSKDFVKSEYDVVDKYVDIPALIVGDSTTGIDFSTEVLMSEVKKTLSNQRTEVSHFRLNTDEISLLHGNPFEGRSPMINLPSIGDNVVATVQVHAPTTGTEHALGELEFSTKYKTYDGKVYDATTQIPHYAGLVNSEPGLVIRNANSLVVYDDTSDKAKFISARSIVGFKHKVTIDQHSVEIPQRGYYRVRVTIKNRMLHYSVYSAGSLIQDEQLTILSDKLNGIDYLMTQHKYMWEAGYGYELNDDATSWEGWYETDTSSQVYQLRLSLYAVNRNSNLGARLYINISQTYVSISLSELGYLKGSSTTDWQAGTESNGSYDIIVENSSYAYKYVEFVSRNNIFKTACDTNSCFDTHDGGRWQLNRETMRLWSSNMNFPVVNLKSYGWNAKPNLTLAKANFPFEILLRSKWCDDLYVIYTGNASSCIQSSLTRLELDERAGNTYYEDGTDRSWIIESPLDNSLIGYWKSPPMSTLSDETINGLLHDCKVPIDDGTALTIKTSFSCLQILNRDNKMRFMAYLCPVNHKLILDDSLKFKFKVNSDNQVAVNGIALDDDDVAMEWYDIITKSHFNDVSYELEEGDRQANKDLMAAKRLLDFYMWLINNPESEFDEYVRVYGDDDAYVFSFYNNDGTEVNNNQLYQTIAGGFDSNNQFKQTQIIKFLHTICYYAISNKASYMRAYYILTGQWAQFYPYLIGDRLNSPMWHVATDSEVIEYAENVCQAVIIAAMVVAACVLIKVGKAKLRKKIAFKKQERLQRQHQATVEATSCNKQKVQLEDDIKQLKGDIKKTSDPELKSRLESTLATKQGLLKSTQQEYKNMISQQVKQGRAASRWDKISSLLGVSTNPVDKLKGAKGSEDVQSENVSDVGAKVIVDVNDNTNNVKQDVISTVDSSENNVRGDIDTVRKWLMGLGLAEAVSLIATIPGAVESIKGQMNKPALDVGSHDD